MDSFDAYSGTSEPQPDVPNAARIYDYDLGGNHNFAVDRAEAERIHEVVGSGPYVARDNRGFLHRAVRFALERGIDQFLDLGSGIPTVGNVHEIAHRGNPAAQVVYVDNEPIAVAHTRQLLSAWGLQDRVALVDADVRDPDAILSAPAVQRLDFSRPVALLMVAVLHYVGHEHDLASLVGRYTRDLAPGSVVAVSHVTADGQEERAARITEMLARTTTPATFRGHDELVGLFSALDLDLVEPGIVWASQWRPDSPVEHPERSHCWTGVGAVR
ncbi:SAM-dependent methyltransferase [Saccharopolyspora sp.]|uniref:SAM-dependent methyltransferase n=1 Tax=Saccharopolyspora sp. TaxID=33915 RepID=UPI0025EC725E|nr:SAM-dependent methyltransferase [Saccharopolyspora sp.]